MTNEWISVNDRLPEPIPNVRISQVPCLCIKNSHGAQIEILMFNHTHECWDRADGDDYECGIDGVKYWMPLPEFPKQ